MADERLADLVRRAHDGEVLGVTLFDVLASARGTDAPDQQARLRAARDHEAATLVHARALADDLGVDVGDGAAAAAAGREVGESLAGLPWDDLVAAVAAGTVGYAELYRDLSAVCDHPAVAELVAHEPALRDLLQR